MALMASMRAQYTGLVRMQAAACAAE